MLTFKSFRDGPGSGISRSLGFDISGLETWSEFTAEAVRFNFQTDGGLVDAARRRAGVCSSGELPLLCAFLAAADFAWLADELTGTEAWSRFGIPDTAYRQAIAAAILRQDG